MILEHPLEERVRRDGACSLLRYQLRAVSKRVLYAPEAGATRARDDITGLNVFRKHYHRGLDGASLYYLDDWGVFQGTRLVLTPRTRAPRIVESRLRRAQVQWLDNPLRATEPGAYAAAPAEPDARATCVERGDDVH